MTNTIANPSFDSAGHKPVSKSANIIAWVLQALLVLAFLAAGSAKLAGVPEMVKTFDAIGIGQWFRYVTAIFEIGGAIALLFPKTRFFAALWLATIMVCAAITHLVILHTNPAPPTVLLLICGIVAYLRRP